jgi:hypothetical protein
MRIPRPWPEMMLGIIPDFALGPGLKLGLCFCLIFLFWYVRSARALSMGEPLTDNNYQIDVTRTVTTGSTRKMALGGAYAGIAEGNAALPDNPAAVAYRARAFMRPLELDMVLSTLAIEDNDSDNSGTESLVYGNSSLVDFGLMAQYENWGIGFVSQMSVFESENLPQNQVAQFRSGTLATGYTTDDRTVALGFSLNPVGARVQPERQSGPPVFPIGRGGVRSREWLVHPHRGAWRFGAAYSSGVSTEEGLVSSGTEPVKVGNLIVPEGVLEADILSLGVAHEWNHFFGWRGHPGLMPAETFVCSGNPHRTPKVRRRSSARRPGPSAKRGSRRLHGWGGSGTCSPTGFGCGRARTTNPAATRAVPPRQHLTGGFEVRLFPIPFVTREASFSYAVDSASPLPSPFFFPLALGFQRASSH